jgi:hypothetical protein
MKKLLTLLFSLTAALGSANFIPGPTGTNINITAATNFDAGVLTNVLRGFVTPYQFGGVGDGSTDDSTALQKWLDYAATNNYTAFLPAASGLYWKITRALVFTNLTGLTLRGAGGSFHNGQAGKVRINVTGVATHGIVISNTPAGTMSDSIVIENLLLTSDTYGAGTVGLYFSGTGQNADGCTVKNVGCQGFGCGTIASNTANLTYLNCSFYNNGDGARIDSGFAHNIQFLGCISTGNRSNALHIVSGHGTWECGDLVTILNWPQSHCVRIDGGQFEIIHGTQEGHSGYANTLAMGGGLKLISGSATTDTVTANSQSIVTTNGPTIVLYGFAPQSADSSGYYVVQNLQATIRSDDAISAFIYDATYGSAPTAFTTTYSGFIPQTQPGLTGDNAVPSKGLKIQDRIGGNHEINLMVGAYMENETGSAAQFNVDLLRYAKDLWGTVTNKNLAASGWVAATNGFVHAIKTVANTYSIASGSSEDEVVLVNTTGKTISLPTAVGLTGKRFTVKVIAAGSDTLSSSNSENIDGATSYSLSAQYKYVTVHERRNAVVDDRQ